MSNLNLVLFPDVKHAKDVNKSEVVLELFIPDKLAFLNGHFDQVAIVPGVTQIHWAVHFAHQYFETLTDAVQVNTASTADATKNKLENFYQMQAIKFKSLILPNTIVHLNLRLSDERNKLYFRYFSQDLEHSSGRLYFNPE